MTTMQKVEGTSRPASFALCICTIDRVDLLERCLDSIAGGSALPDAVIVSDDSADGRMTALVCRKYPWVQYMPGPRKGLCANRNSVIRAATTDYVSLLDDDAIASPDFVRLSLDVINGLSDRVIVTGLVIERGQNVFAGNPTFFGFFDTSLPKGQLRSVNLNCNIFPRSVFGFAQFDESIAYGYEDMDLCSRLLAQGFRIVYEERLCNVHAPPVKSASAEQQRLLNAERARFYTSVKRYGVWEKHILKLFLFVLFAPLHRTASAIKGRRWFEVRHCIPDMALAVSSLRRTSR